MTAPPDEAPLGLPRFGGRREDAAFLRGAARYVADLGAGDLGIGEPGIGEPATTSPLLEVAFVRSPFAHGTINSIDASPALAAEGVVAVHTAESLGLRPFVHLISYEHAEAQSRFPLAKDRVRHVGEAVAMVIAESAPLAVDATELVEIDIEPLPVIIDPADAADGPLLYPESGTNLVLELGETEQVLDERGSNESASGATAGSVTLTIDNPKVSSLTMECDAIVAIPTDLGGLDVWCTSQGVGGLRDELARSLGLPTDALRLRSPAVGGGFGGRATLPVEFAAVAKAALLLGMPLRWVQTRSEQLTGQPQGRGIRTALTLGTDAAGRLVSLEADMIADAGATAHMQGALLVSALRQLPGLYRFESIHTSGSVWLTNTTPVGAYRGAGQPEANHARERAIDVLARRLDRDPIEFRLDNLVDDGPGPVQPRSVVYDAVAPRATLERAIELADVERWRAERASRRNGVSPTRIGIGVSCYAQTSGRGAPSDHTEVRLLADGSVEVFAASPAHGQGHEHTFAALIGDRLGIDPELVRLVDADTDAISDGQSTGGSRTTQLLGSLLDDACTTLIDSSLPLVADRLEVAMRDLVVAPAGYGHGPGLAVAGVPTKRVEWAALAAEDQNGCLAAAKQGSVAGETHPFGTHVSVIELDIDTGRIRLLAHTMVDDSGTVLSPALFEGQQHGGGVAGIGQALGEAVRYDPAGNPLSGTLGTYLVSSVDQICQIATANTVTPTDRNRLGTRGIGENGCNGSTAAVHNAVMDALNEWGVEHLDLPLDPETIWRAISG